MSTNDDTIEARRAAAMWEKRCREAEEAHARDAAVLRALRGEVERLRAPSPDREAELDQIAAAQRARMAPAAAGEEDMPDPDAFDPDDPGDTVSPEDTDRAEILVRLLRLPTADLRVLAGALDRGAPGHRVAALLAAVEARSAEAALDGGSFESGRSAGLDDAARFIRRHLGAPSPLDATVAEVMAVDVPELGEQDMLIAIDELNRELFHDNAAGHKVTLRKLGAIVLRYLAGIQACDAPASAAACPYALMHSTDGRLPCIVKGAHSEHVSKCGQRWGGEDFADHPDFDSRAFCDDGDAAKGGA